MVNNILSFKLFVMYILLIIFLSFCLYNCTGGSDYDFEATKGEGLQSKVEGGIYFQEYVDNRSHYGFDNTNDDYSYISMPSNRRRTYFWVNWDKSEENYESAKIKSDNSSVARCEQELTWGDKLVVVNGEEFGFVWLSVYGANSNLRGRDDYFGNYLYKLGSCVYNYKNIQDTRYFQIGGLYHDFEKDVLEDGINDIVKQAIITIEVEKKVVINETFYDIDPTQNDYFDVNSKEQERHAEFIAMMKRITNNNEELEETLVILPNKIQLHEKDGSTKFIFGITYIYNNNGYGFVGDLEGMDESEVIRRFSHEFMHGRGLIDIEDADNLMDEYVIGAGKRLWKNQWDAVHAQ